MWVTSLRSAASESVDSLNEATPTPAIGPARPPPGLGHVNLSQEALERWERVLREIPAAAAQTQVSSKTAEQPHPSQPVEVRVEPGNGHLIPEHRIPPLQLDGHVDPSVTHPTPPPRIFIPRRLHSSTYIPRSRQPLLAYPTYHNHSPPK
jgi:hypothetical protein